VSQTASPARPNILFIMSDDHAEQAISAYGSKLIETPNIDRIANEGIRFDNSFVTNSICAPSRAVLLTGKYSHLNGLRDNRDEFDGSQVTFPKLLQAAGYETGLVGKWHLKTEPTGFDFWKILIGQGEYYTPVFKDAGGSSDYPGYVTDLITDFALDFLENRDKEKPFCLLYHHKAPHRNWMPDVKHLQEYADRDLPLPETFYDDYQGRVAAAAQDMRIADMYLSMDMKLHKEYYGEETGTGGNRNAEVEQSWVGSYERMTDEQKKAWDAHYRPINEEYRKANLKGNELAEWMYQRYVKDYLRCIISVDENVGRVLDYLDQNGLTENTLVIYTSDQGFYLGEHGWYDKRFMYEESLGMPLVMRYPAVVEPRRTSDAMVLNLDFAPTFLDYAGVSAPDSMQGVSLRPILEGETPVDWRTAIYYHYYEYPHGWHEVKRHYGVRTERYKLIHFYNDIDAWELFDLQRDPRELDNVYGDPDYQEVQENLHAQLAALRQQYQDTEEP
jgi:arylsulfatase A-like enzyme